MRTLLAGLVALLPILTGHAAARQEPDEAPWTRYKTGTLIGVVRAHSVLAEKDGEGVDLGSDPVRALVIYTGRSRPTSTAKQRFIAFYMESIGRPEAAQSFLTEMLFVEDGVNFWLPVQDVLLQYFRKELRRGDSITLFADWIGTTYPAHGKKGLHVFLINEFSKIKASKASSPPSEQWKTFSGPDTDFIVDFPAEPKRYEFRGKPDSAAMGTLVRRYYTFTDTLMLAVSFQELGYEHNSPLSNILSPNFEKKLRVAAEKGGWKLVEIRKLSNSTAEVEAWQPLRMPEGYVHIISRSIVRNGRAYDLQCRSLFIEQEVDRTMCLRFFSSFHTM